MAGCKQAKLRRKYSPRISKGLYPLGISYDRPIKAESGKFHFPCHVDHCNVESKRRRIRCELGSFGRLVGDEQNIDDAEDDQ